MKVALVYDRVNKWGGAERVLLALHEIFPEATLYTSVYCEANASWAKVFPRIFTSFLQNVPGAKNNHEKLPLLMPLAFESFDLSSYDLVISVTSEYAKGVITPPHVRHVCYCLTPTRYLWSGYNQYFTTNMSRKIFGGAVGYLRYWDKISSKRPDQIVAISNVVKCRIKEYYDLNTHIIYPPVDIEKFYCSKKRKRLGYFLIVSRLVKYKKVDLVVSAFAKMGIPLVVVGEGREKSKLQKMASSNIKFLSKLTDEELATYYKHAQALVFPQIEDFGLVAVEAQAAGTPVIAYRGGGAKEIVAKGTGVFFDRQDVGSIIGAVKRFGNMSFELKNICKNAKRFSKTRFKKDFKTYINTI